MTVPGTVSGWQALVDRYGNMDLNECLNPAIEYAENGYPVSEIIALRSGIISSSLYGSNSSGSKTTID